MSFFSKKKFFSFDLKKKHKKCAEVLRLFFESILQKNPNLLVLTHYQELLSWMELPSFTSYDLREIADQYHYHLSQTSLSLKEHNLLPSIRTLDSLPTKEFGKVAIYLDSLRSAFNIGSILRTTEALRLGSVYFSEKTPYIDNIKIQKTSMGASPLVPCFPNPKLEDLPRPLIALDTSNEAISLYDFIFPEKFTLVLGNEEYGVSKELLKEADYLIEIPCPGTKNSINVACAFAMAASEISRQKA